MGTRRQTTRYNYSWQTPPDTPDITAARRAISSIDLTTPVNATFGRLERLARDENFYDTNLPPEARRRAEYARLFNVMTQRGNELGRALANQENIRSGRMLQLAGMTAPRLVTESTQSVMRPSFLDYFGAALGGTSAILGGFGGFGGLLRRRRGSSSQYGGDRGDPGVPA